MQTQPTFNPQAIKRYAGSTVLVAGAARSGLAAAELLLAIGAEVVLYDSKPIEALSKLPDALQSDRCRLLLGEPGLPSFEGVHYLLLSPGIPLDSPLVRAAQEAQLPIIGELGFAAECATQRLLAVSGTNGKTTTVSLLGEMFTQAGHVAWVCGNIGYPLTAAVLRAKPEDVLVVEVSSFQLETAPDFHPQAAALLNITPDHLDRHHTLAQYIALKQRLFARQTAEDIAVLNADDPVLLDMAIHLKAQPTWFSRKGQLHEGAVLADGQLVWREAGEVWPLCRADALKIPGDHNIENALAAIALARTAGLPLPVIAYALKSFAGVEHRIEHIGVHHQVRWLNDSKGTNPDSTIKAIQSMTGSTVLIAGGYDKQVSFDALAQAIVDSGLVRHVLLIGQTADKIHQALLQVGYPDQAIHLIAGLEQAVQQAALLAQEGSTVLFSPACASFDMFNDYEERGRVFKHLFAQFCQKGA